ncbi:hypothetical protein [Anatilimnocola floriformis]|uniref:hypothetical protein n=1 Tax=Anatilimnocola floriformis TaxID=2948575 RepID=UPI0020C4EFD3|nr:hypothetical protein [Anatilimnocola floriformis]
MGFSISYATTRPLTPSEATQIRAAADELIQGYTWLSCEPVYFGQDLQAGRLSGSSKPNFTPHEDDIASASAEDLPDGTVHEMLDILCELSRRFGVDFECAHDHSEGPAGYIRDGECEEELRDLISAFASVVDFAQDGLDGMGQDFDLEHREDPDDDDEDRGPSIFKFPGR